MEVNNVYSAVVEADISGFNTYYKGNINQVHNVNYMNIYGEAEEDSFNLLMLAVSKFTNLKSRIKIIEYLIKAGINVNYTDKIQGKNALHFLYFFLDSKGEKEKGLSKYVFEVTKMLICADIDVNECDILGNIPLKYAVLNKSMSTKEWHDTYKLLLKSKSQFTLHDVAGESCIDAAKRLEWRTDFIDMVAKGKYIENIEYGAFLMSKNIYEKGIPTGFANREENPIDVANGWWIMSAVDDDDYLKPENFSYVSMKTVLTFIPEFIDFYDAPYGTDIGWIYEDGKHKGYWDYVKDKETTVKEIMADR